MFVVEGRDEKNDPPVGYPLQLVHVRDGLTGPGFEFRPKEEKKPSIFYNQLDAVKYARATADEFNKKWRGLKNIVFQVIPTPTITD